MTHTMNIPMLTYLIYTCAGGEEGNIAIFCIGVLPLSELPGVDGLLCLLSRAAVVGDLLWEENNTH